MKTRIDQRLVDLGLADNQTHAQALILSGNVFLGDKRIDKAGTAVPDDAVPIVKGRDHPWVSRPLTMGTTSSGIVVPALSMRLSPRKTLPDRIRACA